MRAAPIGGRRQRRRRHRDGHDLRTRADVPRCCREHEARGRGKPSDDRDAPAPSCGFGRGGNVGGGDLQVGAAVRNWPVVDGPGPNRGTGSANDATLAEGGSEGTGRARRGTTSRHLVRLFDEARSGVGGGASALRHERGLLLRRDAEAATISSGIRCTIVGIPSCASPSILVRASRASARNPSVQIGERHRRRGELDIRVPASRRRESRQRAIASSSSSSCPRVTSARSARRSKSRSRWGGALIVLSPRTVEWLRRTQRALRGHAGGRVGRGL